jgi:hypothetical protein
MDHPVEHMSLDQAREHGWCGGTHRVVCTHIAQLTREALSLVNRVDQAVFPAPAPGGEVMGARNALVCMERAINHLEHAAQELRDEFLRLRDGGRPDGGVAAVGPAIGPGHFACWCP